MATDHLQEFVVCAVACFSAMAAAQVHVPFVTGLDFDAFVLAFEEGC